MTVAALFVDPAGPYVGLPHVDPWDEKRDARSYAGASPVVAHPPCERWGRFADGSPTHKGRFKVGDDGGCFAAAVAAVRTWGGVIEHPQGSHAWPTFGLPIPRAGRRRSSGWTVPDAWGGRSCHIDQGAYGHKAQKPTWLYAVLPAYPELDWRRTWGMEYRIGGAGYHSRQERARAKARTGGEPRSWKYLPEGERHLTPPTFRDALVSLAESCASVNVYELSPEARERLVRELLRDLAWLDQVSEDYRHGLLGRPSQHNLQDIEHAVKTMRQRIDRAAASAPEEVQE